jgi:hypothetical protein
MSEPTLIKVCTVCVQLIANGEYNDGTDAAEKCAEGQVRIWGDNASAMCIAGCDEYSHCTIDEDHECESFEQGFSWQSCEGCGDEHGGDRYLVAVFEK